MKVSIGWLKELVNLNIPVNELINLLPLRSVSIKQFNEDFFELDMKGYNRADLLSMRGVAREVAAITNSKINFSDEKTDFPDLPKVEVLIENQDLCPVYCVAKIENLKVEHSNDTWVKKLSNSGMRSIDNITDVTNLIMLEYGQTIHPFDAAKVKNEKMIVRLAKDDEEFVTLDGKNRKLTKDDLLITDPEGILSLSGIIGGKNSEITETTNSILLEVAIFDPVSIRKTSQRLGVYSEASKRIQHGLTKTNLLQALSAAIKMYEQMGGKLTALTLVGNLEDEVKTIKLNQEKINSLIGVDISQEKVKKSLQKLGFHLEGVNVKIPYWRLDINIEEDLIEEVARMYGYENIPPQKLQGKLPDKIDQTLPNMIYDLKKQLADLGLTEVQTYSFYSSKTINDLRLTINDLVKIANPISSETEYMRDELWPNLVEVVTKNTKNGFKDIAIFEIGKVYSPPDRETYHLAIALMNGSDNPIQELAAIFNKVSTVIPAKAGIQLSNQSEDNSPRLLNDSRSEVDSRLRGNDTLFHPTRFTESMAEVHPRIVNKFGIDQRMAVLEIEIE